MNDNMELKTEPELPSKLEPVDDDLATPLPSDKTLCQAASTLVADGPLVSICEFNIANGSIHPKSTKDSVVSNSQYLTQSNLSSISERSWDSHIINSTLSTEIIVHGPRKEVVDNSSSGDTVIDSDVEIKPQTEEIEKPDENSNPEFDYIFCVATINRTTPNSSKLLAISRIDTNIKVDFKSEGSSLNGYTADHSGSSTNSTVCGPIEEPFLIPKVPRDSFMSLSSSSSSTGVVLPQPKPKSKNILLSKNVYIYPENLVCQKCNHIYPGISENVNLDNKDFKIHSKLKSHVGKTKSKKGSTQANLINNSKSKQKLRKTKQNTEIVFNGETDVKLEEEIQNSDVILDSVENQVIEPISFDIGNKVLAYWVADKMFYPATIIEILSTKYKVEFLSDYVIKSVNVDGLVHSIALKKGSPIAIFDTVSQEYRAGEIVSINEVPNGEDTYTIDLDSEEVVVPFEKLVLDLDNARMLQDKTVNRNYNRLSLSNISEGKRLRLSRSTKSNCVNTTTKSSKRKKTKEETPKAIKKRKCLFPDEVDLRNIPSTSTGLTGGNYEISPTPASEDSDFDHVREDLTTVNMHKLRNTDIDSEHSSPDTSTREIKTPNKSIKVFKDLHIVLSYAKYKRMPMCNDSDQGTDSELSLKSDYFKPDKLHKKYMESLITKNGGTCHRYLNLIPRSLYKYTYIITDTPSQTCNFFLGLSLGIPSYHHKYIEQAVSQKTQFAEYIAKNNIKPIPNGWSVEKRNIVFRSPTTVHSSIFSGYIIYLALSDVNKNEFFAGLLKFCGAIVYTSWDDGVCMPLTRHITIIVTDENCPSMLAHEKVPKLSILWVIQSLICESARPIDGHESYIAVHDIEENNSTTN